MKKHYTIYMRILLAGGGSSGPVSPLIAIAEQLKQDGPSVHSFLFVGTRAGHPEKIMAESNGLEYQAIFSGKLRRYFSWRNFLDLFLLLIGLVQAIFIIKKFKPDVIVSAAGFVAVPVTWAGWLCGVLSLIHQQDILPSLSNKLMAPFARRITVAFEQSLKDFPVGKTYWTGNPIRQIFLRGDRSRAMNFFKLDPGVPTLCVFGGGLGARQINRLVWDSLEQLTQFCQIIHLTGKNKLEIVRSSSRADPCSPKGMSRRNLKFEINNRYHAYEFLIEEIGDAFAVADLVVSRAGLGALTELSVLGKPAIIIPMPNSHQELNAKFFADRGAVIMMDQKNITPEAFVKTIKKLITDREQLSKLQQQIKTLAKPDAAEQIVAHLRQICYNRGR